MMWSTIVFWILLVPLIIILSIVYFTGKKLYRLVYILAIFTYAMTIMYAIDSYQLTKNPVLLLLGLSSALMIFIGTRMRKQKKTKNKQYKISIICIAVILILTMVSGSGIGLTVAKKQAEQIPKTLFDTYQKTKAYEITLTNKYIPRQYDLPEFEACFHNTETDAYNYAQIDNDAEQGIGGKYVNLGMNKIKTVTYYINAEAIPRPVEKDARTETYDELIMIERKGGEYKNCYELSAQDLATAIRIPIA